MSEPPSPYDNAQAAHAPQDGAHLAITLVPGTWAYGIFRHRNLFAPATPPRWFESSSTFRALLESELTRLGFTYAIDVLEWDGANSVRHRAAQADRLAALLIAQQQPGLRRIVIGHSHGGTIACRAASLVSSIQDDLSVITLSTPFLQASARSEDSPRFFVMLFFALLVAIYSWRLPHARRRDPHASSTAHVWCLSALRRLLLLPPQGR